MKINYILFIWMFVIFGLALMQTAFAEDRVFDVDTKITADSAIDVDDTWTVNSGVILTVPAGLIIVNRGMILNNGIIDNNGIINNKNNGIIENNGAIKNKPDALIANNMGATVNNYLFAFIENYPNATITNNGIIINALGSTIYNDCWGIIDGAIPNSGDPIEYAPCPEIVGSWNTDNSVQNVVVSDGFAYVTDRHVMPGDGGLAAIDIRDPEDPLMVDYINTPHYPEGVFVYDNHAYVADLDSGLRVINIDEMDHHLQFKGSSNPFDAGRDVAVSGNYAYVANGDSLQVININVPPPNFPIVFSINTLGGSSDVAVSGNYVYVTNLRGFSIFDITNLVPPLPPALKGTYEVLLEPGWGIRIDDITVSDNHAYIVAELKKYLHPSQKQLQVINISKSDNPKLAGSVNIPFMPRGGGGVAVSGDYAYVANGYNGLQVVYINDPENPIIVGTVDTHGYAEGVTFSGNHAYVADDDQGLKIIGPF